MVHQIAMHRIWTAARNEAVFLAYRVALPRQRFKCKKAFLPNDVSDTNIGHIPAEESSNLCKHSIAVQNFIVGGWHICRSLAHTIAAIPLQCQGQRRELLFIARYSILNRLSAVGKMFFGLPCETGDWSLLSHWSYKSAFKTRCFICNILGYDIRKSITQKSSPEPSTINGQESFFGIFMFQYPLWDRTSIRPCTCRTRR